MSKIKRYSALMILIVFFSVLFVSCGENSSALPSYDIDILFDGEKVSGSVSYTFIKQADEIKFNLYANAYRDGAKFKPNTAGDEARAYPYGVSYGETEVSAVHIDGENADYELIGEDLNILAVALPLEKSGEITVKINFETTIPHCLNRLGISGDTVRLTDCLPVACSYIGGEYRETVYSPFGDPYIYGASDYKVKITLPSKYVIAASGKATGTETAGETTAYTYELKGGRDFAFALSENYSITALKSGNTDIFYYSKEDSEEYAELVKSALGYFSEIFGQYPYPVFSVAETPLLQAGMEFSGLCYIDETLSEENKRLALVHETAHEWWHAAVGFNEVDEAYLDEGLAQYSSYLFFKNNGEEELAENVLENAKAAYKSFFDIKTLLSGEADTSMNRNLKDFKSEYEYVNIAYNKSLIMFSEYAQAVGEKRAIKGLNSLYKNNLYKSVGYGEVVKALGLEEFFNSYVSGKVLI